MMHEAVPAIYFMIADGTKIVVPQESSEYSAVVRRALNSWAEIYGSPAVPPDDDCLPCTGSYSAHQLDGFIDDERNINTNHARRTFSDENDASEAQHCVGIAAESTDAGRTGSYADDDASTRTPSPRPQNTLRSQSRSARAADSATPSTLDEEKGENKEEGDEVERREGEEEEEEEEEEIEEGTGEEEEGEEETGENKAKEKGELEGASPRSYHQRTPCMVGDEASDEEIGLLALGLSPPSSPSGSASASASSLSPASPQPLSPAAAARRRGAAGEAEAEKAPIAGRRGSAADDAAAEEMQHYHAHIGNAEIVIELQGSKELCSPSEQGSSSGSGGGSNGAQRRPLVALAVDLCVEYLYHFVREAKMGRQPPTAIPTPLNRPLVAFLSAWEIEFLYYTVLGLSAEQCEAAKSITKRCPDMSFLYPTPYLRKPGVKAALAVDIPAAERVALLMGVMHTAEILQVSSLHTLCVSWCADCIVRASYSSVDPIKAAELLRKCFSVKSDWSKKEMDCLRLENEWPGDEEE